MNSRILAALLGMGFSFSAFAQTAPSTASTSNAAPILPKVWTGVAGDTSIGAISRKNPLHYLNVGEAGQVKGWNTYDSAATYTILRQEGRHLELQFKNSKYQINEIGTLTADGKHIQIASKEASGFFTIDGDKLTGCGSSRGTNGLFGHWFGSYSAWCDEFTAGTVSSPPSAKAVATLPKVWTGVIAATSVGDPSSHNPNSDATGGKEKPVKGWSASDGLRTMTIIRQEGRHIKFLWKSSKLEDQWIGMLSADGKQMQVTNKYTSGLWRIDGDKISGCATASGSKGTFTHWFNNYKSFCIDLAVGATPPVLTQNIPVLPKEWRGMVSSTSMGATWKGHPKHADNVEDKNKALDWNFYEAPRTLTVLRQEGRHLELLLKTPKAELPYPSVGTLSADGKQIAITSKHQKTILTVSGNTLSGCGISRGNDGTFVSWKNKYAAYCWDLTAAK
jgi:hypothetical protein